MKRKIKLSLLYGLALIAILILLYPFISQLYYYEKSSGLIEKFEEDVYKLKENDEKERIELARIYNEAMINRNQVILEDPFYEDKIDKAREEYAKMLEVNEMIGVLKIPSLNEKMPVYAGLSNRVLAKGVGHMTGTSLPVGGKDTHAVLTAHRGLHEARLFTDLDKVNKGDVFSFTNLHETLHYKIIDIYIIEPDDFSKVLVEKGKDYMTLLTCTPYMINSHRLLLRGERYYPAADEVVEKVYDYQLIVQIIIIVVILLLALAIFLILKNREKKEKIKNDEDEKKS